MAFKTAGEVVSDAALELGLVSAEIADPYASTNRAVVQLRALLLGLGSDLVREHAWTHLQKTATVATVAAQQSYALPSDFDRLVPLTAWDRTTQFPMGVVTPQNWQALQAQASTGLVWLAYRIAGNALLLHPTPTAVETLAYEYVSGWWVGDASATTTDEPTDSDSVLWFDSRVLKHGLKARFQQAKGFDSSAAQNAYERALEQAKGADGAAPVLRLDGPRFGSVHLLDGHNVPDTGFGS